MRRIHRTFAAGMVFACLFGTPAYAQSEGIAEVREKENRKAQVSKQEEIHKLAIKEGISDAEASRRIEAARREFQGPHGLGTKTRGTSPGGDGTKPSAGAYGVFAPPKVERDQKGKIALRGLPAPGTSSLAKSLRNPALKPLPSSASTRKPGPQNEEDASEKGEKKEAEQKASEKPETLHHHGEDSCDRASSPAAIEACKKNRDALERPK